MKQTWKIVAVSALLMTLSTRCATMDGPEAAAKNSFSEWAVNIRTPYRNETFQTTSNDGAIATVNITVDLKIKGEWEAKQTEVQCEIVDRDWQCDRSIQFN